MSAKTELEWRLVAKDSASDVVIKASKAYQDLEKRLEKAETQLGKAAKQLENSGRAAKKSKKDVSEAAKAWNTLKGALKDTGVALGQIGLLGTGAGLGVTYWLKKTAEDIDAISKTSDRLGISTEALSSMGAAAKLAGVESNTLELAIQRMARRIGDASRGFGEATKAFSELGIEIEEIKNLRAEDQFIRIKRALEGVENANRRLSLGAQIFDSEGIRVLTMSADSIEEIVELTEEFGYSFSRIDGAKVEAANDSLAKLQIALNGLARIAVVEFAPAFQGAFDDILETLRALGDGNLKKGVSRFFLEVGETVQITAVRAKGELLELKDTVQEVADVFLSIADATDSVFGRYDVMTLKLEEGLTKISGGLQQMWNAFTFGGEEENLRIVEHNLELLRQIQEDIDETQRRLERGDGGDRSAAINAEIEAIRAATEARRRQLELEKDITSETEKRIAAARAATKGPIRATVPGASGQRGHWPDDSALTAELARSNAVTREGLSRFFTAQQLLVGAGGARAFYSQWLELGRKASSAYAKGLAETEAAQEAARETAELWGKRFVETFNTVRDAGESLWDKLKDAGVSAMERIREEQERQHQESIRKLTEQRLFYQSIGDTIGYGIVDSIEAAIDGTGEWKDVLRQTLLDVRRLFLDQAMRAILGDAIKGTGLFGLFLNPVPSAQGNVFSRGDVVPFAQGGIVSRPTLFPMAGGRTGLMGEAGKEAVVPLRRGPSGRLGIDAYGAGGGGQTNNTVQISAVDGPSFVRLLNSPDGQRWFQATFGRMQQRRIA